jgi:hypothetical protein
MATLKYDILKWIIKWAGETDGIGVCDEESQSIIIGIT